MLIKKERNCLISINEALKILKWNKSYLSTQQRKTIKGQIISGNIAGALKGIETIKKAKQCRLT